MCEINPKRKQFFRLEFFTSQEMPESTWNELVSKRLFELEYEFNKYGNIRVHIHEDYFNPAKGGASKSPAKVKASRENGKLGGRPRKRA